MPLDSLSFVGYLQPPNVPPDPIGDSWRGLQGTPGVPGAPGPVNAVADVPTGYKINGQMVLSAPLVVAQGAYQTLLGVGAGANLDTVASPYTTAIGYLAGGGRGTGMAAGENTLVGNFSGSSLTTGGFNTGFGLTLYAETVGSGNTAVGNDSMRNTTLTSEATAVGHNALRNGTAINYNTAVGGGALRGPEDGSSTGTLNVAIGYGAMGLQNWSTASSNVAIGNNAFLGVTSGISNVFVGATSGLAATTTGNTTAAGFASLVRLTTGTQNTAFGANAGDQIVTTNFNTAIGQVSGRSSGSQNTSVGQGALGTIGTGSFNTCIGRNAGLAITGGGGNTILGCAVGSTVLTTGNNNIFIGCSANIAALSPIESHTFRLGDNAVNTMRATGIDTATPAFFLDWLPGSTTYANDAAAAVGGVAVGQIYRNGSIMMCRVA